MYYFLFQISDDFIYIVSFCVRIRHVCHQCIIQNLTRKRIGYVDTTLEWCVRAS